MSELPRNKHMHRTYNKPDFICIGPTKTGTTWLHNNLALHPDVWLPPVKECRYHWGMPYHAPVQTRFKQWRRDNGLVKMSRWKRTYLKSRLNTIARKPASTKLSDLTWDVKYLFGKQGPQWYSSLFRADKVSGDIDGTYARFTAQHIEKLHKYLPDVKIIMSFRDPISRTWSAVRMQLLHKGKNDPDSVTEEMIRTAAQSVLGRVPMYNTIMDRWQEYFPEEQIKTVFYDDIKSNPIKYLSEICEFLEVVEEFPDKVHEEAKKVIFKGPVLSMSSGVEIYLAEQTIQDTERLFQRTGSPHVGQWLSRAQGILDKQRSDSSISIK